MVYLILTWWKMECLEVMGRDDIYMVKIVFPYCSPSFHFLSPLFLFLLIFFPFFFLSSSFLLFHLFFPFASSFLSSFLDIVTLSRRRR